MSNSSLAKMIFGFLRSDKAKASSMESDLAVDAGELPKQSSPGASAMPPPPPPLPKKPPDSAAFEAAPKSDPPNEFAALNSAELSAQGSPSTSRGLPLIWPEDRPLLPRTLYLALQQYRPTTNRGVVGVECLHCIRKNCLGCTASVGESGIYLFASEKSIHDNMCGILSHVRSCACCPQDIQDDFQMRNQDAGRNEDVAVAIRRVWLRLHQYNYVDCIQMSGLPLHNKPLVDSDRNAKTNVNIGPFCIGSALEESNGDTMTRLRKDWEDDFQETNEHTESPSPYSHNLTKSGCHALFMEKQEEWMDAVTQHERMEVVQENKACSEEMEQTKSTPKVTINDETTNKLQRQQAQECTKAAGRCVATEQKTDTKMEKLHEDALLLTSIVTRADPKMADSNEVTPPSSAVHRPDDTSAFEYTNQEDTLANCRQGNGDSVTSRYSFSLSDFYCAQYGHRLIDPLSESNVSFQKPSDSNSSIKGDVTLQEINMNHGTNESFTFTTRASNQNLGIPPNKPLPRTVIDYAVAAKNKSTNSSSTKSSHMSSQPKSPLVLLSTVCNTPSVTFSSMRCHMFDKADGNEKVYPLNNINENDQKAFMLTYQDIPPMISLSGASGTDLLVHAANIDEYISHKAIRKRYPPSKRKLSETSQSSFQPISLEESDVLTKKKRVISKNNLEVTTPQSDVKPSSDARSLHAFQLAEQALQNSTTSKQLLLSMAIGRGAPNPRGPSGTTDQPSGTVLSKAFLWSMYPSLEEILRENMEEYYEMSTSRCMTKAQLEFNNKLVKLVKDEAALRGWVWGEGYGTDKQIRNRIRCYYKSHIQNAKKRLMTMLRNPKKPSHIDALAEYAHIIQDTVNLSDDNSMVPDLKSCCDHSSSSVDEFDADKNGCHRISYGFDSAFDKSFDGTERAEESNRQ